MTKEFEILPTTAEEWFDKYQLLLEEIDKKKRTNSLTWRN